MYRIAFGWFLCIVFSWPSSAAQDSLATSSALPELGDSSIASLSPQLERRVGVEAMRSIRKDAAFVDDPQALDYINALGMALVTASNSIDLRYEFFLIADPMINAFAMPGGFVGIHTGLLLAAQTESELAAVLAHEISHVTQRHISRGLGKQSQLSVVSIAGALLGLLAARTNVQAGQAIAVASQAGSVQAQLGYSREFEREADRVGLDVLQRAGFDVTGMVGFFERLQKASRLSENSAPSYLQTHPLTGERISDMQNRTQGIAYKQRVDRIGFLLVKAKIRAEQGGIPDAVSYFEQQVREGRFVSEGAARYGLAIAQLRARNYIDAQRQLGLAMENVGENAMLRMLDAQLKVSQGDHVAALDIYGKAISLHPGYLPLRYAEIQSMQKLGIHDAALNELDGLLRSNAREGRLYALKASSYAALGRNLLQHQAQAEVYFQQGAIQAAIEQLQLALKGGDGTFYQLSSVEARLREFRKQRADEIRER
jgi:beta-barrel assembly-enhancing protease